MKAAQATSPWILLVDDAPELRELVTEVLRGEEFNVVPVASGTQALSALRFFEFDAVVTDLNLPDMKGTEVLRAASEGSLPTGAMLVISGDDAAPALGVATLRKPFEVDAIIAAVARCVARSKMAAVE